MVLSHLCEAVLQLVASWVEEEGVAVYTVAGLLYF